MLRYIIDCLALGQLIAVLLYILYWLIDVLFRAYRRLISRIAKTHSVDMDIILFVKNKKEFMDWKKERKNHE